MLMVSNIEGANDRRATSDAAKRKTVGYATLTRRTGYTRSNLYGKAVEPHSAGHSRRLHRQKSVLQAICALQEPFQSDRTARCGRDNTRFRFLSGRAS